MNWTFCHNCGCYRSTYVDADRDERCTVCYVRLGGKDFR